MREKIEMIKQEKIAVLEPLVKILQNDKRGVSIAKVLRKGELPRYRGMMSMFHILAELKGLPNSVEYNKELDRIERVIEKVERLNKLIESIKRSC